MLPEILMRYSEGTRILLFALILFLTFKVISRGGKESPILILIPVIMVIRIVLPNAIHPGLIFFYTDWALVVVYIIWCRLDGNISKQELFLFFLLTPGFLLTGILLIAPKITHDILRFPDILILLPFYGYLLSVIHRRKGDGSRSFKLAYIRWPITFFFPLYWMAVLFLGYTHPGIITIGLASFPVFHVFMLLLFNTALQKGERIKFNAEKQLLDLLSRFITSIKEMLYKEDPKLLFSTVTESASRITRSQGALVLMAEDLNADMFHVESVFGEFPDCRRNNTLFKTDDVIDIRKTCFEGSFRSGRMNQRITGTDVKGKKAVVLSAPLQVDNKVFGILSVYKTGKKKDVLLTEQDKNIFSEFSFHVSMAADSILQYLSILEKKEQNQANSLSDSIQSMITVQEAAESDDFRTAVFQDTVPGINTDYFSVLETNRGLTALLADVAGRGIHSSITMVIIRTVFQIAAPAAKNTGKILEWLNRSLIREIQGEHLAGAFVIRGDRDKKSFEYSGCGQLVVFYFRHKSLDLEQLETKNPPLGMDLRTKYSVKQVRTEPGDILIACTDGVPESSAPDGKFFGIENLRRIILENYNLNAADLKKKIQSRLNYFSEGSTPHDDRTLLILKVT